MIEFAVKKASLEVKEPEVLTSGAQNAFHCQFTFSPEWDGLDKTATFQGQGEEKISVVLDAQNRCTVPHEVLDTAPARLRVSVFGTNGDGVVFPTGWVDLGPIVPGAAPGVMGQEPTPDVYAQILAAANEALQTANAVQELAQSGQLQGPQGPKGEKGDPGEVTMAYLHSVIGEDISASGETITICSSTVPALKSLILYGKITQSATPSPETPALLAGPGSDGTLTFTFSGGAGSNSAAVTTGMPLCGLPVTEGGNVTIGGQQYLADTLEIFPDGSGKITKRFQVRALDGITGWRISSAGNTDQRFGAPGVCPGADGKYEICSHFQLGTPTLGQTRAWINAYADGWTDVNIPGIASAEDLTTWFASQRTAGTPAMIAYSLKTPTEIALTAQELKALLGMQAHCPETLFSNSGNAYQEAVFTTGLMARILEVSKGCTVNALT